MIPLEAMMEFSTKALGLPASVALKSAPLTERGSDRSFLRLTWEGGNTAILIRYEEARVENAYYADIAEFLSGIGVPVPKAIAHDPKSRLMLLEDMGERDLWSFRDAPWETRKTLYCKTLSAALRLHSFPVKDVPPNARLMEGFGPALYQWERDYFRDNFVHEACGITLEDSFAQALETELSALAARLSATRPCLVHRDFQSQNVMIQGGEPYFIDFQGMREGSAFYDLASLLLDPYVDFSDGEREELLAYYYGEAKLDMTRSAFDSLFWDAGAERLMQALGAYGFLGMKKGLASFLGHIPKGLANLTLAASRSPSLPLLQELTTLSATARRSRR